MNFRSIALTTLVLLAGCGGPTPTEFEDSGAPTDAGSVDAHVASDAGVDGGEEIEACSEEGAMRTASCGNCGLASERCEDGVWMVEGPCIGAGECAVGAFETMTTARCGEQSRLCTDACTWTAWDDTTPDGDCAPDDTRTVADATCPGGLRVETCTSACGWEGGECVDVCGDRPRATPAWAEDVCIPSGAFVRGDTSNTISVPVADVMVSAFYIDRYPVTNRRYRACVAAGVCGTPVLPIGQTSFADSAREDHLVQGVDYAQATAFCAWDGGRRLPTEAEWEKAARGAAPRTARYPWGAAEDCGILYINACGYSGPPEGLSFLPDRYDALPAAASPYGVELMVGGAFEWVSDWFSRTYYSTPESLSDPQGPATGTQRSVRGISRMAETWLPVGVGRRRQGDPSMPSDLNGFRCARSGDGS